MDNKMIELQKNETYYTLSPTDAIRILEGEVYIYIVQISEKTGNVGRRILLAEYGNNKVIPAFAWRDQNYDQWRFLLVAKTEKVLAEVMPGAMTIVLKRRFLTNVGIETFENEGYEGSLIEYYKSRMLNENIFIQRGEKNVQNASKASAGVIAGAISGKSSIHGTDDDILYEIMHFACEKCGIDLPDKKKIENSVSEMTVPEIARAAHFICREVVLDVDWYKNDCGVLIVQQDSGLAVCYPAGTGHYRIFDGGKEEKKKLTTAMAGKLQPTAWSIRRTLPGHKLGRKDLIHFVRKSLRTGEIVGLSVLGLLCALIGVLNPKLTQLIYDEYIPMGNMSVLTQVCLVVAAFMIGNVFISIVQHLQEYRIPCRAGYELQDAIYQRIFELPENFFRKYDSADLAQRIMGTGTVANLLVSKIVVNGLGFVFALVYLIQMIHYSGKLAIAGVIMLTVYSIAVVTLYRLIIRYVKRSAEYQGEATGKLYQYLSGVEKIRMAGAEERVILEYSLPVSKEKKEKIRENHIGSFVSVLMDASSIVFSMILYYMMVKSKLNLSMGSFLAFSSAFGSFSGAVSGLVSAFNEYLQTKPTVERIRPVFDTPIENEEDKEPIEELRGDISLEHVSFGYSEGNAVLNDISFHIRPGEYVAFVGQSGCGKSTLLKLLLGFETPWSGSVLYDGKDIATVDKHSLRKKIGVVLQNGRLIAGSIFDNITIAVAHPDKKQVNEVLQDVGLKEDVDAMPMGINTVLSESGGTISGGQQQRILIARAIFPNPSILYFDEATSALDNITQAKVCESLEKRHMTRVVIAHRLSTVMNCDRIYVIDKGHIVEQGNYETLMQQKGMFYQMAIRQIAE